MVPVELTTNRLWLRPWLLGDRDAFAEICADPEVMQHFPEPLSRSQSDALVDRIQDQFARTGWGLWAVEVRESGRFIGMVGLNPIPEAVTTAAALPVGAVEVGWRLAKSAWGFGYATEAATAATEFGLAELQLGQIFSFTALTNDKSLAVMERLGLERLADFDHPALSAGHRLRRHALYSTPASKMR